MHPYLAEFIGTLILILLGNGVVANVVLNKTKGNDSGWIVITFGWGMGVFVAVWCVGSASGAHINPAVTVALAMVDNDFTWASVPGYVIAQMLGGIAGGALVYLVYRDHYAVTESGDAKLATFATAPEIRNTTNNFISEAIGTFVLVFAVLLAVDPLLFAELPLSGGAAAEGAKSMKLGLGALGALPVGLLVFSIGLSLGGTTGYAINPARDLGPRIAHAILPVPNKRDSDWSYAWIPVVGPLAGAALAAVLYTAIA
ncbi:MIP/aquaporin family protein [Adhaeretor mobilis]|uniref:Glycerol uptake facilitator protein n=1 Tax=Adhaeretor mobilis TaxID=1930276 RepID=A0A517N112_9BACT|nr:MIP/aquaporin family protein [Adhaeretor mobilis]QDT00829.1 Glycerol uptake facilitator protein [Adhaeretor mobilis]